jgi:hypothetical protein
VRLAAFDEISIDNTDKARQDDGQHRGRLSNSGQRHQWHEGPHTVKWIVGKQCGEAVNTDVSWPTYLLNKPVWF